MEELNQFLNSVEASARKILKQQNKKQQQLAARDRVALAKGATASSSSSSKPHAPTREELRASYTPGGALVVSAPSNQQSRQPATSPVHERRSEPPTDSDGSSTANLPRLPPPRSPVASVAPGSLYASTSLPTLSKPQPQSQSRHKRAALKLLDSPLYKSLAKTRASPSGFGGNAELSSSPGQLQRALRDVDNVGLLLRKMGLRDATAARSPAHRADHAVEKRMCHACWAKPDKLTGCERHPRVAPSGGPGDALALLTSLELQGPTSWLSDDLYVKYRSEREREKLWLAFCALKQQQLELEAAASASHGSEQARLALVPVVTRHPVCALFATQLELENLRTQAATRQRNLAKTFIFDVAHLWLTNLDHFNVSAARIAKRQQQQEQQLHDEHRQLPVESEPRELRGRRDDAAIREGFSQIPSISSACALQHVVAIGGTSRAASSAAQYAPQTPPTRRRPASRSSSVGDFRPLSLLVCGRWSPQDASPTALERVPGVTLVGRGPVLWWRYEPDHESVETASGRGSPAPEFTKAVALFARSDALSASRAVLVSLVLALDTPVLAPRWFAWCVGSRMPPPELEVARSAQAVAESGWGRPVARAAAWPRSLLAARLDCVLDELLPGPMALLNAVAESEDHWLGLLERPKAPVGHRRGWDEFQARHGFRQWLLLARDSGLAPRYDVQPRVCSVSVAHANAAGVCGRYCWHETLAVAVATLLCRRRVEKDLVYVLANTRSSGPNDPSYFSVVMAHEAMADVQGARLATYLALLAARDEHAAYEKKLHEIEHKLEAGRLALEAKRQEQQRLEREQQLAAARDDARRSGSARTDAQDEVLRREWLQRLANSSVLEQRALWEKRELSLDNSGVTFFHSLNSALPVAHRFRWETPEDWHVDNGGHESQEDATPPSTERSGASADSSASRESSVASLAARHRANAEAQAALAVQLLQDEHFVRQLRAKLGLSARSESRPSSRATARPRSSASRGVMQDEDVSEHGDARDDWADMLESGVERSKSTLLASRMAKLQLQLPPRRVGQTDASGKPRDARGQGWKRLRTSRLPPQFARRVYRTHTQAPRSSFIGRANAAQPVGMLDPAECSPHDPPEFIPELRAHFVPRPNADLQERKRVWAHVERARGRHATAAGAGDATTRRGALSEHVDNSDMLERDPEREHESKEQRDARALLCARNNNLEGLEAALDDGVDVNVRDNHGNTLFVLVCQQGNKRLAKFLLRRRADMNLQNLNGNTALHYLYEYKHVELAEYLKAKGAVDTTQNAAGLTCYEGLSQQQVDNL